jgi:uncharacterized membrane protein
VTRYEILLTLHVVAVVVWLGAGFTMDLLFLRAERMRNPAEIGKTPSSRSGSCRASSSRPGS